MSYTKGIYMDYRFFDKINTKAFYPFSFGLLYTTYAYGDMKLSNNNLSGGETISVTFRLVNRGYMSGGKRSEASCDVYFTKPARE